VRSRGHSKSVSRPAHPEHGAERLSGLETFPTPDRAGGYADDCFISTSDPAVNDNGSLGGLSLSDHAVVVHGMGIEGEYAATLPVARGTLGPDEWSAVPLVPTIPSSPVPRCPNLSTIVRDMDTTGLRGV
jgi:hypothetical protein